MTVVKGEDGIRRYATPLGALPSVTSVLKETESDYKKKIIREWREKDPIKADAIRDTATTRGNAVHDAIEKYAKLDIQILDVGIYSQVNSFVSKIEEWHSLEEAVYHPSGYAGRFDAIATYQGKLTLFDWKTSYRKKVRSNCYDYFLQLAAYRKAIEYRFPKCKIEQAAVVTFFDPKDPHSTEEQKSKLPKKPLVCLLDLEQLEVEWGKFSVRLSQYYYKNNNGDF